MRARQILSAIRATRTCALSMTMAIVVAVLGSVSAGALAAQPHQVRARAARSSLLVARGRFARRAGGIVVIHGLLRPRRRGAEVKLMTRTEHRWHTLAVGRTRRDGRFGIRYRVRGQGTTWVRVRFGGSRRHRAVSAAAGRIVALAPAVASWYEDAGNTACGFHATYGVANKTLPCGTRVTLSYDGRTVVATVDDRGPYIYGRSFDLNQNTARFLGMWGVATVFASV